MPEVKIFCTDLDHTAGKFIDLISSASDSDSVTLNPSALGLRKGFAELLRNFSEKGFINILTTSGGIDYVKKVLSRTGIERYFQQIYTGDKVFTGSGKILRPVLEDLSLSEEQARKSLVITGDLNPDDAPADTGGVVFIFHPNGYKYDAEILDHVQDLLWEKGKGDFGKGFEAQYHINDRGQERNRQYQLANNIIAGLYYQRMQARGKDRSRTVSLGYEIEVPVLQILSAPAYRVME